jgi:hypothetical protein
MDRDETQRKKLGCWSRREKQPIYRHHNGKEDIPKIRLVQL